MLFLKTLASPIANMKGFRGNSHILSIAMFDIHICIAHNNEIKLYIKVANTMTVKLAIE